jgi:ribonucleoside-triphosphate reductase
VRNLEDVERDIEETKEALTHVEGNTAEVYSRIVGYYRSVRNWNKGKREEYGERKLFEVENSLAPVQVGCTASHGKDAEKAGARITAADSSAKVLLFVRPSCPHCPPAKNAVAKLGLPVETVDAATTSGFAEAAKWTVMSTPTAILLSKDGKEIARAQDSSAINKFRSFMNEPALKSA